MGEQRGEEGEEVFVVCIPLAPLLLAPQLPFPLPERERAWAGRLGGRAAWHQAGHELEQDHERAGDLATWRGRRESARERGARDERREAKAWSLGAWEPRARSSGYRLQVSAFQERARISELGCSDLRC